MNRIYKLCVCLVVLATVFTTHATKIALLSDIHVTPGNANQAKLAEAVAEINANPEYQIVILCGDLSNEGSDKELMNVKTILDSIKKPFYIIPGNHENNWSQSAGKKFIDLWGDDKFVTELDDMVIIAINCGPYMKMGDGFARKDDLIWIDETLQKYPGKRVISICHYPLAADLDNYKDYIRVLQKYPVAVHLCGHYHVFRHEQAGGIDVLYNRALDMTKGNYGYTVIEIANDSVKQWNKLLGKAPKIKNAFKIKSKIEPIADSVYVAQKNPEGYKIEKVYQDNASIFTRVGVDKKNIYFGNSHGESRCVDKKTGKDKWSIKTAIPHYSRPAVAERYVIFPTGEGKLIWADKKNGKIVKEVMANGPYVADGVVKDGVLYQGGYNTMEAWDVNKKVSKWSVPTGNYCQAAPAITDNDITFGAWDTKLRNVDITTGKLNWEWSNGRTAHLLSPGNVVPVVSGDRVIIVAPDRFATAIDRNTGKQIWRVKDQKVRESLGSSADGKTVYAKTMDGTVIAMDATSDEYKLLWSVDAGFGYEHAPCIVLESNGIVYTGSRMGMLSAIDPINKKLLWTYQLGISEINGFDVDENGDIYASLIEGTVWRISPQKK